MTFPDATGHEPGNRSDPDSRSHPDPRPDPTGTGPVAELPGAGPVGRPSLGWTELVTAAVAYFALSILAGLAWLAIAGEGQPSSVPVVALTGVATLAAVGIALAVRVRAFSALGLRATTGRWILVGVGAGVLAWLVNRLVIAIWFLTSGDTTNPQQGLADSSAAGGWELVGLLLAGAVLVPIAEELLFRGVGYGALRRYGVWVATIASALLFGLAHGINVVLPAAIVIGVINAALYERSRSIWPSVTAHAVNNAIVFVSGAILLG